MAYKSYGQIIERRNEELAKICQVYLLAAPNEQCLRFLWAFCNALFRGRYAGKLVELSAAKEKSKIRLGIVDTMPVIEDDEAELTDQQTTDGAEMEGSINASGV